MNGFRIYPLLLALVARAGMSMAASPPPKQIRVDHASVCGSNLDVLEKRFASVGLVADYGGPHAHGGTQMALLGFPNGSYIELIAPQKGADVGGSGWGKMIVGDAGPCAWAIGSTDIKADVAELKQRGIEADGPNPGSRTRPDGKVIEWETAALGNAAPGSVLPFMIQDMTPRELRVRPSKSVEASGLSGIEMVVIGVDNLQASIDLFRRAYGWSVPSVEEHQSFGARLAYFSGSPVVLATPLNKESWLSERLQKFGQSPVAYLLRSSNSKNAHFSTSEAEKWFGKDVSWFDAKSLGGVRLGVVQ